MSDKPGFISSLIQKVLKILVKNLFQSQKSSHIQHVVHHEEGWAVRGEGNEKYTGVFDTQVEAINRAKEIAKNYKSGVVIHGENGRIRDRISYSD